MTNKSSDLGPYIYHPEIRNLIMLDFVYISMHIGFSIDSKSLTLRLVILNTIPYFYVLYFSSIYWYFYVNVPMRKKYRLVMYFYFHFLIFFILLNMMYFNL